MIQDIFPHQFSNVFENSVSSSNACICPTFENQIFLLEENNFLKFIETPDVSGNYQFLFKLDSVPFYFKEQTNEEKDILSKKFPEGKWIKRKDLRNVLPKHIAFVSAIALQLADWYKNNQYCGRCQSKTQHDSKERMVFCPKCNLQIFPKISPAVIIGVFHQDKILLTKYRNGPTANYALVAGFCEIGETLEDTVCREVKEEVGLQVKNIRYYKSQPWPFTDTLLAGFFCELDGSADITLEENELSLAEWHSRNEIPVEENFVSLTNEMILFFKNHPEYFEKSP